MKKIMALPSSQHGCVGALGEELSMVPPDPMCRAEAYKLIEDIVQTQMPPMQSMSIVTHSR